MIPPRSTNSDLSADDSFSLEIIVFSSNPIVVYVLVFLAILQPFLDFVRYS